MRALPDPSVLRHRRPSMAAVLTIAALVLLSFAGCAGQQEELATTSNEAAETTGDRGFFGPTAYEVPYDVTLPGVPQGDFWEEYSALSSGEKLTALGTFAWKEFIALNWPTSYGVSGFPANQRGEPDTNVTTAQFTQVGQQARVWQTYRHRVEVFPMADSGGTYPGYPTSFDGPPQYFYRNPDFASNGIRPCGNPSGAELSTLTSYFNNLDETSEIGLCTLFVDADPTLPPYTGPEPFYSGLPGQPRRFIYQAKANRAMFDYIYDNQYYDMGTRWAAGQATYTAVTTENQGGVAPCPGGILCFPPGDISTSTEGMIEVKATWRQLTADEYNSGRFLTATIINYTEDSSTGETCYQIIEDPGTKPLPANTVVPYGLTGLHIIHKTTNFPTFVFATFEQVDNLDSTVPGNDLFYYNFNSGIVNPGKQYVTQRAHPIPDAIVDLNQAVHDELRSFLAANGYTDSVWNYYQLVGVQGEASDYANDIDFFLANVTTETNEVLRSFSGGLDMATGTIDPTKVNIYQGDQTFIGGGCKGCHGNAQAGVAPPAGVTGGDGSFDFSFITANAPFDGEPDLINADVNDIPANWYPDAAGQHTASLVLPPHGPAPTAGSTRSSDSNSTTDPTPNPSDPHQAGSRAATR